MHLVTVAVWLSETICELELVTLSKRLYAISKCFRLFVLAKTNVYKSYCSKAFNK